MSDEHNHSPTRAVHRDRFAAGAVEYVTAHGIGTLSLRPLAAYLGTSDRMLIYYFGSRAGLISAICDRLTAELHDLLTSSTKPEPIPPAELLNDTWRIVSEPRLRPTLALHLEIDALAARGTEPFDTAAHAMTEAWLEWIGDRIDVPAGERASASAALLAIIDGLLVQSAAHPSTPIAQAHHWLSHVLGTSHPTGQV